MYHHSSRRSLFSLPFGNSTHLINGTMPLLDPDPSISKLTSNLSAMNR
jgi:hypothetical protein